MYRYDSYLYTSTIDAVKQQKEKGCTNETEKRPNHI